MSTHILISSTTADVNLSHISCDVCRNDEYVVPCNLVPSLDHIGYNLPCLGLDVCGTVWGTVESTVDSARSIDRSITHNTQHATANKKLEHENLKRKDTIFFVFSFLEFRSFVFRILCLSSCGCGVWGASVCVLQTCTYGLTDSITEAPTYSQRMNLHPYSSFEVSCLADAWSLQLFLIASHILSLISCCVACNRSSSQQFFDRRWKLANKEEVSFNNRKSSSN